MYLRKKHLTTRINSVRETCRENSIDALLISNPLNCTYLTGISQLSFFDREAFLILTSKKLIAIVSPLIYERFSSSPVPNLETHKFSPHHLSDILNTTIPTGTVAFEDTDISVAEHKSLSKKITATLVPAPQMIEQLRVRKDEYELACISKACQIAARTWRQVKPRIKPGMTEQAIANLLTIQVVKNGADGMSPKFPPIVASGVNSAIPHHVTSRKKIAPHDCVLVDFGCLVNGYNADMTRTIQLGKPTPIFQAAQKVVNTAYKTAVSAISAHQTIQEIDSLVHQTLAENKFADSMPHSTGHGIGLDIHEPPTISHRAPGKTKLQPNTTITVEPGIYIPNQFGIRYENTVIVTATKYKNLTA